MRTGRMLSHHRLSFWFRRRPDREARLSAGEGSGDWGALMKGGAHASHLSSAHGQWGSRVWAEGLQQDWGRGRDGRLQALG